MKKEIIHEKFGKIELEESFWTGKKTLTIDGKVCTKINKKEYYYITNGEKKTVYLKGDYIRGATLTINNVEIEVFEKSTWYEYLFTILPIIFVIIWGNSPKLVEMFPIVGGAIGGAISAICGACALIFMKGTKNPLLKILIGIVGFALAILICYVIAIALLSATVTK